MAKVIDILFGCPHKRTSFPITLKTTQHSDVTESPNTYIVCLDCGREFPYDWQQMKLRPRPTPHAKARVA
jgi:hypothetical protein